MQYTQNSFSSRGFTLVELSVVMVIIGLIVGGILIGQTMIANAELNSVISDVNKYKVAINTFRNKYGKYPGDLKNATDYWGAANTVNGDGDGRIYFKNGSIREGQNVWNQLGLAGMIEGQYRFNPPNSQCHEQRNSSPHLDYHGGSVCVNYGGMLGGTPPAYHSTIGTAIILATVDLSGTTSAWRKLFYPMDALTIDRKVDDGVASSGKVYSVYLWPSDACVDGSGNYANLDDNVSRCIMFFEIN